MASLRPRNRPHSKDNIIGRFMAPDGRCKKHPKHRQSPGVCSLCLKDKLSQLSSYKTITSISSCHSSSASSSVSSYSSSSTCATPSFPFHKDSSSKSITASNNSSVSSIFLLHGGALKSRSMSVFATRRRTKDESEDDHNTNKSGKKSGFWSKLFHPKTKTRRMDQEKGTKLLHTMSVLQMVT